MNTYTVRRRLSRIQGVTADSPEDAWHRTWPDSEEPVRLIPSKCVRGFWSVCNEFGQIGAVTLDVLKGSAQDQQEVK